MKTPNKFRRSFRYAYEGIQYALSTQHNMKFHFFIAFCVLSLALALDLGKTDMLFLLLAVTLVIVCELMNTALEKTVDLAMPERHPLAKIAKDVAAASVLVSAAFAAITGIVVFYEPLLSVFTLLHDEPPLTAASISIMLALIVVTLIIIQTRLSERRYRFTPSLLSAIAFAVATLQAMLHPIGLTTLLGYSLALLVAVVLYEKKRRTLISLLLGCLIGVLLALLVLALAKLL